MVYFLFALYLITSFYLLFYYIKADFTKKSAVLWALVGLFVILSTCRTLVSTPDVKNYKYYFDFVQWHHVYESIFDGAPSFCLIENGFLIYNLLFRDIVSTDFNLFLGFVTISELFLFINVVKNVFGYSKEHLLSSIGFFLPYFGLFYMLVTIRAGLAFGLAANALSYCSKNSFRKLIVKIALYSLAIFFHRTSVLFILLDALVIVISFIKNINKLLLPSFILVVFTRSDFAQKIVFVVLYDLFSFLDIPKFLHYVTDGVRVSWGGRDLAFFLLGVFFIYFRKHFNLKITNCLWIYVIGLHMGNFLGGMKDIAYRITDVFLLTAPFIATSIYTNKYLRRRFNYLLLIFIMIYSFVGILLFIRVCGYWKIIIDWLF